MSWFKFKTLCFCLFFVFETFMASSPYLGRIYPGFVGSQMNWIDHRGQFLQSNNSIFSFGFFNALAGTTYVLVVTHVSSSQAVWTANRGGLVENSDNFVFENNGNVYLEGGNGVVWSTNTGGQGVVAMELLDSGNLVLLDVNGNLVWQSFSYPTDTLLPGQEFSQGMSLKSFPRNANLYHYLEMKSGNLVLYVGYQTPQIYWSITDDNRKTNNISGMVHSVSLVSNSWNFYDRNRSLLSQFIFSKNSNPNTTMWAAILGTDGSISFKNLHAGRSVIAEPIRIPQNSCSIPEPCDPYSVCSFDKRCQCPLSLSSISNCNPKPISFCNSMQNSSELSYIGAKLNYFAIGFVEPVLKSSSLNACREACVRNCSCSVLFFNSNSMDCFLFDQIGSLQRSAQNSTDFVSYMKVSVPNPSKEKSNKQMKRIILTVSIVVPTVMFITVVLYLGFWYHRKRKILLDNEDTLEENSFLDSFSGMPVRYSYNDLSKATKNFSLIVGRGGFGSVYLGVLPDGTQLAVKKLEAIGQGKKEFRSEVNIIGSIHHIHLVKLKGFCSEGAHRLLVYEYMGKGSLDKWIFKNDNEGPLLDWNTRYNIALGTAKGLAYLHEECEMKIVHCDIKPENVLLDDNYIARVSDFGLAKLMNPKQSVVYTTLRGTRGYLAPEWLTNYAISEKSDVYSFGLVLLEIIGGRKNYDQTEIEEKAYFPSYALKMFEEGKVNEILDPKLDFDENDERIVVAVKVALWCIQDEMHLRPPMTKVVQMLEGLCDVPHLPTSFRASVPAWGRVFNWSSEDGKSSIVANNSDSSLSAVQLSGPR